MVEFIDCKQQQVGSISKLFTLEHATLHHKGAAKENSRNIPPKQMDVVTFKQKFTPDNTLWQ